MSTSDISTTKPNLTGKHFHKMLLNHFCNKLYFSCRRKFDNEKQQFFFFGKLVHRHLLSFP